MDKRETSKSNPRRGAFGLSTGIAGLAFILATSLACDRQSATTHQSELSVGNKSSTTLDLREPAALSAAAMQKLAITGTEQMVAFARPSSWNLSSLNIVMLNLPDGQPLNFKRRTLGSSAPNSTKNSTAKSQSFFARTDDGAELVITQRGKATVGRVHYRGKVYRIRAADADTLALVSVAPSTLQSCTTASQSADSENVAPIGIDASKLDLDGGISVPSISAAEIRILVVYTEDALKGAAPWYDNNENDYIKAEIDNEIAVTNDIFENSDIRHSVKLAKAVEIDKDEGFADELGGYLYWLRQQIRDSNSNIYSKRESYAADVVSLWVNDGLDSCGIGYVMTTVTNGFKSSAVNVVDRNCNYKYTFTHELGHNLGCRHDSYVESSDAPFAYAHGHTAHSTNNYSVMAYDDDCKDNNDWWDRLWNPCTRQPVFSNPDISIDGAAMGSSGSADNARVIDLTGNTVANFK